MSPSCNNIYIALLWKKKDLERSADVAASLNKFAVLLYYEKVLQNYQEIMSAIWDTYKYGKENPFYNDPMQKAYYHPSPPRKMDGIARQTFVVDPGHKDEHLTEEEESRRYFLDRSNSFLISRVGELDLGPDGDSVSFDESWPQSERPSTISIISEVESLTPPSAAHLKSDSAVVVGSRRPLDVGEEEKRKQQRSKSEVSGKKTRGKKGSTLSKFIERFRNSQPKSREQRRLEMKDAATEDEEEEEDFWWLQSPSSSAQQDEDCLLAIDEELKKKTKLLQENNNNLSEKMSSVGSSHLPAVSTVGLGSDDTTGGGSFEEEPYRPGFVRSREPIVRVMSQPTRHRRHDDDDILYRWRIQRKRELAKDQVTKFRAERPYSNFSSQFKRQWDADVVPVKTSSQATRLMTADAHSSQPTEKDTEMKRDAFIATTSAEGRGEGGRGGVSDEQQQQQPSSFVSYIPTTIACCRRHHVAPSGTISIVNPHCRFSCCDALTQSTIESLARDASKHNAATTATTARRRRAELGDGDGLKQVDTLKTPVGISSDSRMDDGKRIASHAVDDLDGDSSDENNIPEKDVQRHSTTQYVRTHLVENERNEVNDKKSTLHKHPVRNERSLRPQKVVSRQSAAVDDFNETEVWQTTDNEGERLSAADEELRRDHRERKRLMGGGGGGGASGDRAGGIKNSRTIDVEDKERGIQQKTKSDKDRRQQLCTAKNEISSSRSSIPIRSTITQVVNDRLLLSASLVTSSVDNFELSSLDDLTITELEEEEEEEEEAVVVDIDESSAPAANLGGRRSPVDLESVICSDGEEFADDDILCNLRQRRLFCLQRLQELDRHLNLDSRN